VVITMHLNSGSSMIELKEWQTVWAEQYPIQVDEPVLQIANPTCGYLTYSDLETVLKWKVQERYFVRAKRDLQHFVHTFPGQIEARTAMALAAPDDRTALEALRGLPAMKSSGTVAVASAVLMVLNTSRWSVMDRRANETLVALRSVFSVISDPTNPLFEVGRVLSEYFPPAGYVAVASDWPMYMHACRMIANLTDSDLRGTDRALYSAKGSLALYVGHVA